MSRKGMQVVGLAVAVVMLVLVVAGCAKQDPSKKKLVFAIANDIETLDVQQMYTGYTSHTLLFAPLISLGLSNDNAYPYLAESVEIAADGMSITLVFPDDLKFSNGKNCTGQDILKAIERYRQISPYASDWEEVKEVKAEGQKLTIYFKEPTAYFLPVLSSTYSGIVDVQEAEKLGKEGFGQKPVGIGPYVLKQWVQGSHLVFEKNPYYKDHLPFVKNHGSWAFDEITVRIIPDNFTRISELEAGNVDVTQVPVEFLDRVKSNSELKVISSVGQGETYLALNTEKAPFSSRDFRLALNYAINKDEIKSAWMGSVEPIYGLVSPSQLAYSEETEKELRSKMKYDLQKARTILAELGCKDTDGDGYLEKDGKKLSFTLLGTSAQKVPLTVIQNQLKAVGIEVKIQEQAASYVRQAVQDRNYDMALRSWSWPDPDIWYYSFHSSMGKSSIWSSPELDKLLEEQRKIVDPKARAAKWGEISRKIAEDVPFIPLYYSYNYTAVRNNIEGYQVSVSGAIYWNDAVKK